MNAVDFLNEQLLYFALENWTCVILSQMPDKHDTYTPYQNDLFFYTFCIQNVYRKWTPDTKYIGFV